MWNHQGRCAGDIYDTAAASAGAQTHQEAVNMIKGNLEDGSDGEVEGPVYYLLHFDRTKAKGNVCGFALAKWLLMYFSGTSRRLMQSGKVTQSKRRANARRTPPRQLVLSSIMLLRSEAPFLVAASVPGSQRGNVFLGIGPLCSSSLLQGLALKAAFCVLMSHFYKPCFD